MEKGVIFTAKEAEEFAEKVRQDEEDLRFSGLNNLKKNVLWCIRREMSKGNKDCRCYGYLYDEIYGRDNYILWWVKSLGFDAEIARIDGYNGIIVSWKEKNLSQS